jgi:hypothetical protein
MPKRSLHGKDTSVLGVFWFNAQHGNLVGIVNNMFLLAAGESIK